MIDSRKSTKKAPETEAEILWYQLGKRRVFSALVDPRAWEELLTYEPEFCSKLRKAMGIGEARVAKRMHGKEAWPPPRSEFDTKASPLD